MHETTHISISGNAERMFNILLSFYPKQHRKRFGKEMRIVFYDLYQEEINKNGSIGIKFWLSQFADITKSALEQHIELASKIGMKKYLQQTLHINKYNIIGFFFLLPFLLMISIDLFSRIAQGDLVHYNRPVYHFLSHTPLYWTPVLFTWVFLFPLVAIVINLIPLLKQIQKTKVFSFIFLKKNIVTFTLITIALGCIAVVRLHDFAPCMVHGIMKVGIGQLPHIMAVCRNA